MKIKVIKKRASVFDPYVKEVQELINIGVNLKAIYRIINHKMSGNWSYEGFYIWVKKSGLKG